MTDAQRIIELEIRCLANTLDGLKKERDSLREQATKDRAAITELRTLNIANSNTTLGEVATLREQLRAAEADLQQAREAKTYYQLLHESDESVMQEIRVVERGSYENCLKLEAALAEANRQRDAASLKVRELDARLSVLSPTKFTLEEADRVATLTVRHWDEYEALRVRVAALEAAQSHGTFAEGLEAARKFVSNFRWAYQVPSQYRDDLVEAIRAMKEGE